jgi:ABC-type sulfate transport system permease subunit
MVPNFVSYESIKRNDDIIITTILKSKKSFRRSRVTAMFNVPITKHNTKVLRNLTSALMEATYSLNSAAQSQAVYRSRVIHCANVPVNITIPIMTALILQRKLQFTGNRKVEVVHFPIQVAPDRPYYLGAPIALYRILKNKNNPRM